MEQPEPKIINDESECCGHYWEEWELDDPNYGWNYEERRDI